MSPAAGGPRGDEESKQEEDHAQAGPTAPRFGLRQRDGAEYAWFARIKAGLWICHRGFRDLVLFGATAGVQQTSGPPLPAGAGSTTVGPGNYQPPAGRR